MMNAKLLQSDNIRQVMRRLNRDICDLTLTWAGDSARLACEICDLCARFDEEAESICVLDKTLISGSINQARADLGEVIRRLFGARNFGFVSDEVYHIFRHRCKFCIRILNELEDRLREDRHHFNAFVHHPQAAYA